MAQKNKPTAAQRKKVVNSVVKDAKLANKVRKAVKNRKK